MAASKQACLVSAPWYCMMWWLFPVFCLPPGGPARATEPAELRESLPAGSCTQVRIELKAEGLFRPGLPVDALKDEATMPKPLALNVKTRLVFAERLLGSAPKPGAPAGGRAQHEAATASQPVSIGKAVRRVLQAAAAINGEVRPTASVLRPISRCWWPNEPAAEVSWW